MGKLNKRLLAGLVVIACVGGCNRVDRTIETGYETSITFTVERPGSLVFDDIDLGDWLSDGQLEQSEEMVATAACHALIGHAGEWVVGPASVVARRVDLIRVAEMISDEVVDPVLASQVETHLFETEGEVPSAVVVASNLNLALSVVEKYFEARSAPPRSDSLDRFVVYAQNRKLSTQQLVFIDRGPLVNIDFERLPSQYSSVQFKVAGATGFTDLADADCTELLGADQSS